MNLSRLCSHDEVCGAAQGGCGDFDIFVDQEMVLDTLRTDVIIT